MKVRHEVSKAEIRLGEGVCSIRRKGISSVVCANIVGAQVADDGITATMWLDRLVHGEHEHLIGDEGVVWSIRGAFVSELTRQLPADEVASFLQRCCASHQMSAAVATCQSAEANE